MFIDQHDFAQRKILPARPGGSGWCTSGTGARCAGCRTQRRLSLRRSPHASQGGSMETGVNPSFPAVSGRNWLNCQRTKWQQRNWQASCSRDNPTLKLGDRPATKIPASNFPNRRVTAHWRRDPEATPATADAEQSKEKSNYAKVSA